MNATCLSSTGSLRGEIVDEDQNTSSPGVCLAFGSAPARIRTRLTGFVGLSQRPDDDLDSPAHIECFNDFGHMDDNCTYEGDHSIKNTATLAWLVGQPFRFAGSQWINYLRAAPRQGHCYRADLYGRITWSGWNNSWQSLPLCDKVTDGADIPDDGCPVLLDLDANGFHLSGPDHPILFDLNGDGVAEPLAWTSAGERDGFLCMDRNRNGRIDDGSELFGSGTRLASGERVTIGYVAMAELDLPEHGGNFDGVLGPEDQAFASLCSWVDGNRDGVSQPEEITSLTNAGVLRLRVDYRDSGRRDAHGNYYRFRSEVWITNPDGRPRSAPTYDVFFAMP